MQRIEDILFNWKVNIVYNFHGFRKINKTVFVKFPELNKYLIWKIKFDIIKHIFYVIRLIN